MGRDGSCYMEQMEYPEEGEVLVIEVDGKATPTYSRNGLKPK